MNLVMRQERISRGWSQEYVGKQIGVTPESIHYLETGQRKPSYDVLVKLLDLFDTNDPRELFAPADAPTNPSIPRQKGGRKRG